MKFENLKKAALLLVLIFSTSTLQAQEEDNDFNSLPSEDNATVEKLTGEVENKTTDMEMGSTKDTSEDASEDTSYKGLAHDSEAEEHKLKVEARGLEREIISLKSGTEKSKNEAHLAQKRLEMQQKKMVDLKNRHNLATKEHELATKKKEKVATQLAALEEEVSDLKQKNQELTNLIKEEKQAQAKMTAKIKKEKAAIALHKKRQAELQKKRAQAKASQLSKSGGKTAKNSTKANRAPASVKKQEKKKKN